jgi:hypothetical protein
MPKTAVHEDNCPATAEYEVGLTWQVSPVQAVTIP